jgi:hypothetical protein
MSLRPTPSPLALHLGTHGDRRFVWDAIADNGSCGISVSDSLPIEVSHFLAAQADVTNRLVITDSPDRWAGYQHVSPDDIGEITVRIQPILERPDRLSLAMLVFDVTSEKWTAELAHLSDVMRRQGRSYGMYVLVRSPIDATQEDSHAVPFPMVLAPSTRGTFPELQVRYHSDSRQWEQRPLTIDLEPA